MPDMPSYQDQTWIRLWKENAPELCEKIQDDSKVEYSRVKDICYMELAELMNNESYCELISEHADYINKFCR